jgi:hypothetical protein
MNTKVNRSAAKPTRAVDITVISIEMDSQTAGPCASVTTDDRCKVDCCIRTCNLKMRKRIGHKIDPCGSLQTMSAVNHIYIDQ